MASHKLSRRKKYINITMRAPVHMKGIMGSLSMYVHIVVDKVGTVITQRISAISKPKDRTETLVNRF